jgi:hypothetical protein
MTEQELQIGMVLLVLALLAFAYSGTLGTIQAVTYLRIRHLQSKQEAVEETLNLALDQTMVEVFCPDVEPPKPNYRHNIHCPSCGRFAKKFEGSTTIVICKVHEMQVRWQDEPIDWLSKPVTEGVIVSYDNPLDMLEFEMAMMPLTEPLDIIIPDDLTELYELGARI